MYILDTNKLIYFFKGVGKVAEKFLTTPPKELVVFQCDIDGYRELRSG